MYINMDKKQQRDLPLTLRIHTLPNVLEVQLAMVLLAEEFAFVSKRVKDSTKEIHWSIIPNILLLTFPNIRKAIYNNIKSWHHLDCT